jgi:hypothetical protein
VSAFSDLRTTLADDLAELGVTVSPSWPTTLNPPCAFITPPLTDDYAKQGPNFGEHTIALDLVLLVDHDDAESALSVLESLIAAALVHTADWTLTGVDAPAPTTVSENGAEYLASVIHLSKPVRMGV